jgi:uncharacterized membrane protein
LRTPRAIAAIDQKSLVELARRCDALIELDCAVGLVDIAIKALSPAINDPTTAVQAIDQIEDLLRRLGRPNLEDVHAEDRQGIVRLIYPTPNWEDFLSLSFDEIRQHGVKFCAGNAPLRSALVGVADSISDESRIASIARRKIGPWPVNRAGKALASRVPTTGKNFLQ